MIRKGDIVTIKPEWRDPGADRRYYVAIADEESGIVDISPVDWPWRIKPVERVKVFMLEGN